MRDDRTDLFTGSDDPADGPFSSPDGTDPDPLDGDDPTDDARRVLTDLTYHEAHAFAIGFGPLFIGLLLFPFLLGPATILVGVSALTTALAVVQYHRDTRPLGFIIREVHYYLGGGVLAAVLGVLWVGLVRLVTVFVGGLI